jgi:hypothetical protein
MDVVSRFYIAMLKYLKILYSNQIEVYLEQVYLLFLEKPVILQM